MKQWSVLLFPLAWIYNVITALRNRLFDWKWISSYKIKQASIGIGNLSVGGTGKSVVVDYLITHFKNHFTPVVVSRGYKRKSRGVVVASEKSTVQSLGDEPYQFFSKHGVAVVVAEKRKDALNALSQIYPQPNLILLDDVLQHRYVKPRLTILTTTFSNPYYSDHLIPWGWLRESKLGAKRAQIILVTKCPDNLSLDVQQQMIKKLNPSKDQSVFFTKIACQSKVLNRKNEKAITSITSPFLLVTGVANPEPLVSFLREEGKVFEHYNYPNHHEFKTFEIEELQNLKRNQIIITTEKDFGRLEDFFSPEELFYLPIEMEFLEKKEAERFKFLVKSLI